MVTIERKLQQANLKRENLMKLQKDNSNNYENKLSTIKTAKEAIQTQHHWETMNKVLLKHHDKD